MLHDPSFTPSTGDMKDPTANLLLSALAMTDPDLIHQLSISTNDDPVGGKVKEDLCHMLQLLPDPDLDTTLIEVYSDEWPELLALVPVRGGAISPIISWTPGLGTGKPSEVN